MGQAYLGLIWYDIAKINVTHGDSMLASDIWNKLFQHHLMSDACFIYYLHPSVNFFLNGFVLGHTGLTWTYRRPYARTRWHLRDSNP